jgi:hypothetical protein
MHKFLVSEKSLKMLKFRYKIKIREVNAFFNQGWDIPEVLSRMCRIS